MTTVTVHQCIPLPPTPLALSEILTIAHAANPTLIEAMEISEPTADIHVLAFTLKHLFAEFGMPQVAGVLRLRCTQPGIYVLDGEQEGMIEHLEILTVEIHSGPTPKATIDCTIRMLPNTPDIVVPALKRIFRKAATNTGALLASVAQQRDLNQSNE